jgi:hypothetical protein
MTLNISVTSSPLVRIEVGNIGATVKSDLVISVLDGNKTVPVACIAVVSFFFLFAYVPIQVCGILCGKSVVPFHGNYNCSTSTQKVPCIFPLTASCTISKKTGNNSSTDTAL